MDSPRVILESRLRYCRRETIHAYCDHNYMRGCIHFLLM